MRSFRRYLLLCLSVLLTPSLFTLAQSAPPIAISTPDGSVPRPTTTGVLGIWDPAAITEITNYRTALGSGQWTGMQAVGQIIYGTSTTPVSVTLSIVGATRYRLDERTASGLVSTRIHQPVGRIKLADGTVQSLPETQVFAGLFPFHLPRLLHAGFSRMSLRDQGVTVFGSLQLHRLTLERPTLGMAPNGKVPVTSAIDYYFDPATHLLAKSVAQVGTTGSRGQTLTAVTSYSDYRLVGTTLVPFHFVETLEGEQALELQLSTVELNPKLDDTNFTF